MTDSITAVLTIGVDTVTMVGGPIIIQPLANFPRDGITQDNGAFGVNVKNCCSLVNK